MNHNKNIYLTGFMGSGKTRVGKLLSQKLNRRFVDTDQLIQEKSGQTINEIFEKLGEAHFRQLEKETLVELSGQSRLVVSLGGGAVLDPANQEVLKNGVWIFLDTPFEMIKERVERRDHRPLGKDPQKLEELYKTRLPIYHLATHVIRCQGDAEDFCQSILEKLLS